MASSNSVKAALSVEQQILTMRLTKPLWCRVAFERTPTRLDIHIPCTGLSFNGFCALLYFFFWTAVTMGLACRAVHLGTGVAFLLAFLPLPCWCMGMHMVCLAVGSGLKRERFTVDMNRWRLAQRREVFCGSSSRDIATADCLSGRSHTTREGRSADLLTVRATNLGSVLHMITCHEGLRGKRPVTCLEVYEGALRHHFGHGLKLEEQLWLVQEINEFLGLVQAMAMAQQHESEAYELLAPHAAMAGTACAAAAGGAMAPFKPAGSRVVVKRSPKVLTVEVPCRPASLETLLATLYSLSLTGIATLLMYLVVRDAADRRGWALMGDLLAAVIPVSAIVLALFRVRAALRSALQRETLVIDALRWRLMRRLGWFSRPAFACTSSPSSLSSSLASAKDVKDAAVLLKDAPSFGRSTSGRSSSGGSLGGGSGAGSLLAGGGGGDEQSGLGFIGLSMGMSDTTEGSCVALQGARVTTTSRMSSSVTTTCVELVDNSAGVHRFGSELEMIEQLWLVGEINAFLSLAKGAPVDPSTLPPPKAPTECNIDPIWRLFTV